jgi:diguanylate cyclase (GGDEF)-like protein
VFAVLQPYMDGKPGSATVEFRMLCKDGSWKWTLGRGMVVSRDADGKPVRMIGTNADITERKRAEVTIRELAFYDSLTKLPNRHLLNDRLSQAMATCTRSGCYGAVMFLDLDNFKPLNDMHGHAVGDLLLVEVAERLRNGVRKIDTVSRFGGDEFVVVINGLDEERTESTAQAGFIAEKIRRTLSEPYQLTVKHGGKADTTIEHHCTVSVGVALFLNHESSQDDILKWADAAMYQAKDAGRNSIRFIDTKV